MAFRDDVHALRTRLTALERELARATARADDAELELELLRRTIVRLRSGLDDEARLRTDPHLAASEGLMPIAALLGAALVAAVPTLLVPYDWYGHVEISIEGVRNLLFHLERGGLASLAATVAALPFAVLPSVASIGIHLRKGWGWAAGMLAYATWTLLLPPLGAYGLFALGRRKIRERFLLGVQPVPRARVEVEAPAEDRPVQGRELEAERQAEQEVAPEAEASGRRAAGSGGW